MTVALTVHILKKITTIKRYNEEFICQGAAVHCGFHFYSQKYLRLTNVPFLAFMKIVFFRKSQYAFSACLALAQRMHFPTARISSLKNKRIKGMLVILTELLCLQQCICLREINSM